MSEKELIKIGIIGFGRMGVTHFAILNTNPNVRVVGICEPDRFIHNLVRSYLEVEYYKDYYNLIDRANADAIVIATPPAMHQEIVEYALKKEKHIFVEKPFTVDYFEAIRLAEIVKIYGKINQVGYVYRYNDIIMKIKEILEKEMIGKILYFTFDLKSPTITRENKKLSWRGNENIGGGVIHEMASHIIDLINYLLGKPDEVSGIISNRIYSKDAYDQIACVFNYNKEGKKGFMNVNWSDKSCRKPTLDIELFGDAGKIIADLYSIRLFLNKKPSFNEFKEGWNIIYITDVFSPVRYYLRGYEFTRQIDLFIDQIRKQEISNMACTFEDAVKVHEVIKMIKTKLS